MGEFWIFRRIFSVIWVIFIRSVSISVVVRQRYSGRVAPRFAVLTSTLWARILWFLGTITSNNLHYNEHTHHRTVPHSQSASYKNFGTPPIPNSSFLPLPHTEYLQPWFILFGANPIFEKQGGYGIPHFLLAFAWGFRFPFRRGWWMRGDC